MPSRLEVDGSERGVTMCFHKLVHTAALKDVSEHLSLSLCECIGSVAHARDVAKDNEVKFNLVMHGKESGVHVNHCVEKGDIEELCPF